MTTSGVDGTVELVAELGRRSISNSIAADAPRSAALYRYLGDGMSSGSDSSAFIDLALALIQDLGIWWTPDAYAAMPTMVPWCVRDRSCRYDQGPESWGSPRADGYLRDDNSIIKKLPLPLLIRAPQGSVYEGRKPWRGFTACHIWRDLPGGEVAGADPWLYSFIPNLIWVPSWLAPLTDRQGGHIQSVLQQTSLALFGEIQVRKPLEEYAKSAWQKLPSPPAARALSVDRLAMFDPLRSFYVRRLRYLEKFVRGCDEVLNGHPISEKLICSRYTDGLPTLEHEAIRQFRDTIDGYRTACSSAL
jgi:hypothetical protein